MRTVAHLYDTYETAVQVTHDLEAAGFYHDDVSIVANQHTAPATTGAGAYDPGVADPAAVSTSTAAGTGASVGTILGGGAGLLAGIGALAIPGVGPVVAAGWLVATLTGAGVGAGAGGLLGSLTGAGVDESHAHVYTEGVRRGGTLVTVRADESRAAQAETIMQGFHPVDIQERGSAYRSDPAWTGFDATGEGLTREELEAGQMRSPNSTLL